MKTEGTLKHIVEAALLAAGRPLSVDALLTLFLDDEQPDRADVKQALADLAEEYDGRGIEVREVSSGWRIQVRSQYAPWVSRLWEEKPPRYSRALMETLALIAYRQPITRGEIEEIRGVAVSTNIVKTLLEREWVRVVGHRDVPGKPALYATTKAFLDYFGLTGLDDLPTLAEIRDLDSLNQELAFSENAEEGGKPEGESGDATPANAELSEVTEEAVSESGEPGEPGEPGASVSPEGAESQETGDAGGVSDESDDSNEPNAAGDEEPDSDDAAPQPANELSEEPSVVQPGSAGDEGLPAGDGDEQDDSVDPRPRVKPDDDD